MSKYHIKRLLDISLSSLGLFISLPFWCVIILCIVIEDGLPIFYPQDRVGKDGVIFKAIKFRSMIKNAEENTGPIQAKTDDRRITGVGKILRTTALDELPQLLNILKGQMSFVGPRALRSVECEVGSETAKSLSDFIGAEARLAVTPGLTGVAQVFAARDICRKKKFKYDIWYIKNKSILLDIKLVMLSFLITFLGNWETKEFKTRQLGEGLRKAVEEGVINDC